MPTNYFPIDQGKLTHFMKVEAARELRPALISHAKSLLDLHFKSVGRVSAASFDNEVVACVDGLLVDGNDSAQCIALLEKSIKAMVDAS